MEKRQWIKTALRCLLFVLFLPASSLIVLLAALFLPAVAAAVLWPAVLFGLYWLLRKKLIPAVITVNGILAAAVILAFTVCMAVAQGNAGSALMKSAMMLSGLLLYPGGILLIFLIGYGAMLNFIVLPLLAFFLSVFLQKRAAVLKKAIPFLAGAAVCFAAMAILYANSLPVRNGGHGFDYMHGYSSTDFSDYMVYSEPSKLVTLDHPASLSIEEEENMPKLDGAEACYPVYAAVAKAVYKDIAKIERSCLKDEETQAANGKIVRFTNTVRAFENLVYQWGKGSRYAVDLFFGARPSQNQLEMAGKNGVDVTITPIGKEAFVFFVEPDNPVTDLSSEQLRQIYHGTIENWSEVGGKNQAIRAFQRPENSGSQTMMQYFMGEVALKTPTTYESVSSMGGTVREVAQYANEAGAIGYSFRYFVEELSQENDVRILAVDGILPTKENIENGTYPLTVDLCVVSRTGDPNPNVQKLIDFLLSDDGQEIIRRTGYGGLSR